MSIITLDWHEMNDGATTGLQRLYESGLRGLNPHQSTGRPRPYMHRMVDDVTGAQAERAVCKHLGLPWESRVNTFHDEADVGAHWEVRATGLAHGKLILRGNDPLDHLYILVIAEPPTFTIKGMMRGRDARQPQWVENPGGRRASWFVPQDQLQPLALPIPRTCTSP